MTDKLIQDKLRAYLATACLIDFSDGSVNEETDLFQMGWIDSFGFVELVQFMEGEFAIKVTDDDLVFASFNSVNELVQFVGEKRNAN